MKIFQKKFKAENDPIVLNIARGFYWQEMIDSGKITNIRELAKIMNVNESYIGRTIRLTMLLPEIIHRVICKKICNFFKNQAPLKKILPHKHSVKRSIAKISAAVPLLLANDAKCVTL